MDLLFYWILAVIPALPLLLICIAYRRILASKRLEIDRILSGEAIELYLQAYGGVDVKDLFDLRFHWRAYISPVFLNMFFIIAASVVGLGRAGMETGLPPAFQALLPEVPNSFLAALAGAYVWGLYDVMRRYTVVDLSPGSLHFIWLRLLIAGVLGALVSLTFVEPLDSLAAFGLGAFPVKTLRGFAKEQARKRFQISTESVPAEKPTLDKIQGMTAEMIDRLADEGLDSPEQLAHADPIKLLFSTNLEWKVILDLIDQAYLFTYIGNRIEKLRPIGIRGAIEVADVGSRLLSKHKETQEQAEKVVTLLTSKLAEPETTVRNLIRSLLDDPQVYFIWTLWGETSPIGKQADVSKVRL